jgi:hypothetical protein
MSTVTITLPAPLQPFVERQMADRGLADPADYLIELVREAVEANDWLEEALIAGLDSADRVYDDAFRADLSAEVEQSLRSRDVRKPR